jgi:chemotaxis protein methyltransferase CheR
MQELQTLKKAMEAELGLDPKRYQIGVEVMEKLFEPRKAHLCPAENGPQHDLVDEALIHESYFMRYREQLDWIIEDWIPQLYQQRKDGGAPIRILSAGSSRGEEVYSLKILMEKKLPEVIRNQVQIYGVDVSRAMVKFASDGRYTNWSMRGMPDQERQRWFINYGQEYEVRPFLRERVMFCRANLMVPFAAQRLPMFPEEFDLVLCRNVLIYMTKAAIRTVYRNLYDTLTSGGCLVLGPSDPVPDKELGFHAQWVKELFILEKPGKPQPDPPNRSKSNILNKRVGFRSATLNGSIQKTTEELHSNTQSKCLVPVKITRDDLANELFKHVLWASQYQSTHRAIALLEDFLERFPLHCEALLNKAILCHRIDRITDAISTTRQLLFLESDHTEARFLLAQLHASTGNHEQAERHYRMAVSALRDQKPPSNQNSNMIGYE